jgi:hypothetical protein
MIRGVTDKSVLVSLGLSRRLVVRLGVLLKRKLAFSEAVLESAERGSPLERLLLSKQLLDAAAELNAETLGGLTAEAGVTDALEVLEAAPGRVVALAEEVEAEGVWDDSTSVQDGALAKIARSPALTPSSPGDSRARAEIFSPAEIEKLKLTALTSARADEAIGAMRQLAYAPIPVGERGDVFVRALAGLDPQVRAEAARLLAGVGLAPEVSEALVALATAEEPEKRLAIDRLGRALAGRGKSPGEADLVLVSALVALTSALTAEQSVPVRGHVLSSLAGAASVLASFPERLAEVLRHVVELLVADYSATLSGATELLDALRPVAGDALGELLRGELEKTQQSRVRTLFLTQISALARESGDDRAAAGACESLAKEFSSGSQSSGDRQALAAELLRMPANAAARSLLDHFAEGVPAAKRYCLRLLADLCRYRQVEDEVVERSGRLFLQCLKGATKDLRLAVFETLLPADTRISEEIRADFALAYIENFSDLVFRADIELAESTLAHIGIPALPVLLARLEPSWPASDRTRACRVIGEVGSLVAAGEVRHARAREELRETARHLLRTSAANFPDPGELAVAMGKLAAAIDQDLAALETVWHRVSAIQMSQAARLEALSWVAAGKSASKEMVLEATKGLLEKLAAPEPDSLGEVTEVRTGAERTLELSAEASDFVSTMPAVVRGLARVALAPAADPAVRSRVLTAMINRWKDLISGRRIWGPAAATTMIEGLRDLACHQSASPSEKMEVIRALGMKLVDPPAMRAVAEVLAADADSPELAGPAASAALALLNLRDPRGRFPEEDRAHVLWSLARILGRATINTTTKRTAKLRERIAEELYEGLNDNVPGVYESLAALAKTDGVPPEFRAQISERLAARGALAAPSRGRRQ